MSKSNESSPEEQPERMFEDIVKAYLIAGKTMVVSIPIDVRNKLGLMSSGHFKVYLNPKTGCIVYEPIAGTLE